MTDSENNASRNNATGIINCLYW